MAKKKATPEKVKPFLKWAGGKRQILKELLKRLPPDVKDRTYREPFLGAGSLFFALKPSRAVLSDANKHLIMVFRYVRDCPDLVSRYLRKHAKKNCERYYYTIRDLYNKKRNSCVSAAQAARFIYLNKTCYNGIFRVNRDGAFNVPYGKQEHPALPSLDHLRKVSNALGSARLVARSFEKNLASVNKNDFIYLDPPYPPLNGTSYFTHYTADKFGHRDQEKLASVVKDLDAAGCLFMVSNADTKKIRQLYRGYNIVILKVTRYITCKKVRHKVRELIVKNF